MDYDWFNLFSIYPIIKCSLDQVPPIRGLQSFVRTIFLQFEGWMMNVGIWRTSFSCPVPLGEERSRTLELWTRYCYVIFRQRP